MIKKSMSGEILRLMLGGAMDNMDGVLQSLAAPAQAPPLPSVSEIADIMQSTGTSTASPRGTLSGGKRAKSGGSRKKSRKFRGGNDYGSVYSGIPSYSRTPSTLQRTKTKSKSLRSKRADMRERYRLSPRKRVRRVKRFNTL